MLGCYYKQIELRNGQDTISYERFFKIIDESESKQYIDEAITWHNLPIMYKKYISYKLRFYYKNKRKGQKIYFENYLLNYPRKPICQWKTDTTGLHIVTYYVKATNISINDILDYHDNILAIQYLTEKGLKLYEKSRVYLNSFLFY